LGGGADRPFLLATEVEAMVRRADLRREDGFTLIELMTVTLILGVILLMAMSTLRGFRERALDTAAKKAAAGALETGRVLFTDHATYAAVTPAELEAAEPNMRFFDETTGSGGPGESSTWVPDRATTAHIFVAAVYSRSGKCFYVRDWITVAQPVGFGVKEDVAPSDCTADQATTVLFLPTWPST
jgi:prepilin-type N-terminal cleavage/methylation domain-containing protein